MFTILKHRKEDAKAIDLGEPSEKYRIILGNCAVAIMLIDQN